MTDHCVTIEAPALSVETLTYDGRLTTNTNVEILDGETDVSCSCGVELTSRPDAIDHLQSTEESVDWGALAYSLESALPDGIHCDLDDQLLVTHENVRIHLRIYVESVTKGKPSEASVSLWDPVSDANAATEAVPFSDAIEMVVRVARQLNEGTPSFSQLALTMGDEDAADAHSGVELEWKE